MTERLRFFVQARQQFTDIRGAWKAFLDYLNARRGADIRSTLRLEELAAASRYVESDAFEQHPSKETPDTVWFRGFETREYLLASLETFLRERGLVA